LSTDVYYRGTPIYLWHCSCKSWSLFAVNDKFHKCVLWINCELWTWTKIFFLLKIDFLNFMALNEAIRENWLRTFEALYRIEGSFVIFTNFLIGFSVRAVKLESLCTYFWDTLYVYSLLLNWTYWLLCVPIKVTLNIIIIHFLLILGSPFKPKFYYPRLYLMIPRTPHIRL
jgi:hypothetical protein